MRHCGDCEVFKKIAAERCGTCYSGSLGCHGLDLDCPVDHADAVTIWCAETQSNTCEHGIICENRLTDRELIELLLERTVHIANVLYRLEDYVNEKKRLEEAELEKAMKEKWEEERTARIAAFEEKIAALPEWVPAKEAGIITGLSRATLLQYAKYGKKIKWRTAEKGRWEYWKEDLLAYTGSVRKRMEAPPGERFDHL